MPLQTLVAPLDRPPPRPPPPPPPHAETEYGEMHSIPDYLVLMCENTDPKNSKVGQFSRSDQSYHFSIFSKLYFVVVVV